ncbi:MAG TPA: hypothetical protein VKB58_06965 [Terriglobales bacterium]|nr:hypothetical protein [Terriglobales bacterium]
MRFAKLSHKFCPPLRPSFFQDPSQTNRPKGWPIGVSPLNHLHQKRQQSNASFGKTVDGFLFMAGIVRLDDDALLDQSLKTISQNIRRNPFRRLGQEFAKMPAILENDVADDEQAPLIAKHLDHQVDNTA